VPFVRFGSLLMLQFHHQHVFEMQRHEHMPFHTILRYPPKAKILRGFNISDEDVAKHLDAAGVVLRDKKMLNIREPEILATDIEGEMIGVTMIIPIECDPSEVFSYNVALAKKEEEAGVRKHPAFDVVFAAL